MSSSSPFVMPQNANIPARDEQNEITTHMEKLLISCLEEEILKELGEVLGNAVEIIRQRLPGIVVRCRKRAQTLSEENSNADDSSPPTTPTASSNSGAESLFDRPEVNPSSTTLDTDFGPPVLLPEQQTQSNAFCDLIDWDQNFDYSEFGGMSHWDPENNWGLLPEFSDNEAWKRT